MSAKVFSRDYALGKVKKLQRMKQPLTIKLILNPPRNPVVFALAHRAASAGAGKHIRAQGAMRRAEKVTLQKLARQLEQ
ncbi:MAG: hypothetical protein V4858_00480 [Pseudomonadota bacterium]